MPERTVAYWRLLSERLPLLFLALAIAPIAGCWDREEVNGLAIVTSVGLDRKESGAVEMTLEIIVPKQEDGSRAQSGSQPGGGGQTIVRSAEGETAADAVSKLQAKLPRTIYWGQLEMLVVGEKLARAGFREQLDYLVRDNEVRLRVQPFVFGGSVRDFFASGYSLEQTKADFLGGEAARLFPKPMTMNRLIQKMTDETEDAVVPLINLSRDGKETAPYIKGYAVLSEGRMAGEMDEEAFSGTKWVLEQLHRDIETVKLEASPPLVSLMVMSAKTRLIPHLKGDRPAMEIRIETELSIIQNTTPYALADPEYIRKTEKAEAEHIRRKVELAVERAQKMKSDVFGFGEAINRSRPREWNRMKARWKQVFPSLEVEVAVRVNVRRIGMNNEPVGRTPKTGESR
ncbi:MULTISPECIES: Ger(x)C family spore germination protein [Cohnella]|uniref:Ger(x)C family spore germination protein n=1 Tax=Cohnella TaxID=329857 RepID=UPI0009B938DE|nr:MULTISPECIES: Ger(x)C family spore germination protein [Cohnella]MBN2979982.1 Ger(x)C family spore germination protein [Cohnella algarum]